MPLKREPNSGLSRVAPMRQGASKAKPGPFNKRLRPDDRDTKLAQAEDAKKKKKKKEEIQSRKPAVCDFSFVYVGNLVSTITTTVLENFFKGCGQIKRTIIRCSRGQAVTAGLAVPKEVLGPRDRQYASIEFMDAQSARKALARHGMVLGGCQLVVSVSAADLPEVQDIVQNRVASMHQRQFGPMPPPINTAQRPIIACPTEPFADPRKDRHNLCGFSFPKSII